MRGARAGPVISNGYNGPPGPTNVDYLDMLLTGLYTLVSVYLFLILILVVAWFLYVPLVVRIFSETPFLLADSSQPIAGGERVIVVAEATDEVIIAGAGGHRVISIRAFQQIVSGETRERVVACKAHENVVLRSTCQGVVGGRAREPVAGSLVNVRPVQHDGGGKLDPIDADIGSRRPEPVVDLDVSAGIDARLVDRSTGAIAYLKRRMRSTRSRARS